MSGYARRLPATEARAGSPYAFAAAVTGAMVAAVGAVVLVGWLLDAAVLKSVNPNWVTVKANTATCLLLVGIALALSAASPVPRSRSLVSRAAALVVVAVTSATLAEYILDRDLRIDQFLFNDSPSAVGTGSPGRMAPNTAAGLLFLAIALGGIDARLLRVWPAQYLAIATATLALLPLLDYAYGAGSLTGVAYTRMAFPTATALLAASAGCLLARPARGLVAPFTDEHVGGRVARTTLPPLVLFGIAVGALHLWGEQQDWYSEAFALSMTIVISIYFQTALLSLLARSLNRKAILAENAAADRDTAARAQHDQQSALLAAHRRNDELLASIPTVLVGLDDNDSINLWNGAAEACFGRAAREALGRPWIAAMGITDEARVVKAVARCRAERSTQRVDRAPFVKADGSHGVLGITVNGIKCYDSDDCSGILVVAVDISERERLTQELAQVRKLEAVGQLAAGIAHEINTPVQYVGDNLRFLGEALESYSRVLSVYTGLLSECEDAGILSATTSALRRVEDDVDLPYLSAETPSALQQSLDGLDRVITIVRAMKDFAHPGTNEQTSVDINHLVNSTVTVARNEWKYVSELVLDLDDDDPTVLCFPGEIGQVILNLVINAAHAIKDVVGETGQKGTITVRTRQENGHVVVAVEDTGGGVPEAIRTRVFDPFFTTKEVGAGTGQGLAIAHRVVVEKHGGRIWFEPRANGGTIFFLSLPIGDVDGAEAAA